MKTCKILAVVFAVIAAIGLISCIAGTRSVNFGAFIFPAILAVIFSVFYFRKSKK